MPQGAIELQFEEDYESLRQYNFLKNTMDEIRAFYDAKKAFLRNPNFDTRCEMKDCFQYAHSDLKVECTRHVISPSTLQELTELLKRGL